jgi:hypothetical protein
MYKLIGTLSILCLLCANTAFGQAQVGLTTGVGVAYKENYPLHQDGSFGRSTVDGIFYQRPLKNTLSLRTELLFEHRVIGRGGITFTDMYGNAIKTGKLKAAFNYLTLPILIRTIADTKLKPFAEAGPYMGYWLSTVSYARYSDGEKEVGKVAMSNAKRPELGLAFGAGMSFSLSEKLLLSLALRGNIGLTNTVENSALGKPIRNEELYFLPSLAYNL